MDGTLKLVNGTPLERVFSVPTNDEIEAVEAEFLGKMPSVECPVTHRFAPGVYIREIFMPANTFVIGHEHLTEHFNIVLAGSADVMMNGELHQIEAPWTGVSKPHVRKVLYIRRDMIWQTVHANPYDERHLPTLEADHVVHSESYEKHFADLKNLKSSLEAEQSR